MVTNEAVTSIKPAAHTTTRRGASLTFVTAIYTSSLTVVHATTIPSTRRLITVDGAPHTQAPSPLHRLPSPADPVFRSLRAARSKRHLPLTRPFLLIPVFSSNPTRPTSFYVSVMLPGWTDRRVHILFIWLDHFTSASQFPPLHALLFSIVFLCAYAEADASWFKTSSHTQASLWDSTLTQLSIKITVFSPSLLPPSL